MNKKLGSRHHLKYFCFAFIILLFMLTLFSIVKVSAGAVMNSLNTGGGKVGLCILIVFLVFLVVWMICKLIKKRSKSKKK